MDTQDVLLKVPVTIFMVNNNKLGVSGGGEYYETDFPILPYEYIENVDDIENYEEYNLIGGGKAKISKCEYQVMPMKSIANGRIQVPAIDYTLQLIKDHPDIIESLSKEITPYPMFLDIETASSVDSRGKRRFSKSDKDPIVSIQLKFPDTETIVLVNENGKMEKDILLQFLQYCISSPTGKSPDICVGYNNVRFDGPYTHTRLKILGLISELSKASKVGPENRINYPNWQIKPFGRKDTDVMDISGGVPMVDLYHFAKTDVTLSKLPSRTLKNVAEFYGSETVADLSTEEKGDMMGLLQRDRDKFMWYATSDIVQTEYLWDTYKYRLIGASNLLSCPLSMVHWMSSGQKSYLALYREAKANKYFSLVTNGKRYNELYSRAEKYQGATVGCFKKGYFGNTIYLDAASMYPNIMDDFNISYDRYELEETIEYEQWYKDRDIVWTPNIPLDNMEIRPAVEAHGPPNNKIIYIPDDNYHIILKTRINLIDDGFMRILINKYNNIRKGYKTQMKRNKHDEKIRAMYDSYQAEAKIINNTFYGIQGNKYYETADLPAAIMITALGRWIMSEMIVMFGDKVISVDTDGLLLDRSNLTLSIEEINDTLRKRINSYFGVPLEKMKFALEFEGAGSVYMYKMKNYILRENSTEGEAGKLIHKGSAFVGYGAAPVVKRAVKLMGEAVMHYPGDGEAFDNAYNNALDIKNLPDSDFMFSRTIRKRIEDYKSYNSIDIFVENFESSGIERNDFSTKKKRVITWIKNTYRNMDTISKKMAKMVRECKNNSQLDFVIRFVSEAKHDGERAAASNMMLDMLLDQLSKGVIIEEDDVIQYYYTLSSNRYTLIDDMDQSVVIHKEKYAKEIKRILDRFRYADPRFSALDFASFMDEVTWGSNE